jgi:tetratricopeptide (TPR) repeat protein
MDAPMKEGGINLLTEADRYILAARLKNYLGKYEDAVTLFTEALERYPDDARLYRHRGHRYITLRRYDAAIHDLERAAGLIKGTDDEHEFFQPETERDIINILLGREDDVRDQRLPVTPQTIEATKGLYKSTLHVSVYYHLALAYYLQGNFEAALSALQEADARNVDDDMRAATADWMYMTLRRLGREDDANALIAHVRTDGLSVTAGEDYYLQRLRMYKGEISPEDLLDTPTENHLGLSTHGYGVGNYYLYTGRLEDAKRTFKLVVERGARNAFGYMAAEADLARL